MIGSDDEDKYNDSRYERKYNTPGLRQPKEDKGDFSRLRQHMRGQQGSKDSHRLLPREPEEQDPVWMQRLFIGLAIPTAAAVVVGLVYLLMLNAGNFGTYATGIDQNHATSKAGLPPEEIAALAPDDQYAYYGQRALRLGNYGAARKQFNLALETTPDHEVANRGLYSALLELVKKDSGWNVQLKQQEERMASLQRRWEKKQ